MSGTTDITQDLSKRITPSLSDQLLLVNADTKAVQAVDVNVLRNFLAAFFTGTIIPQRILPGAVLGTPPEVQIYYAQAGSYTTPTGVVDLSGNLNMWFWNKVTWSYMEVPVEVDLTPYAPKADIVNNLTSGGVNKILSAEQGVVLSDRVTNAQAVADVAQEDIENIETILPTKANKADVIDNVTAGGVDKILSAQQGVILSGRITTAQAVADVAQEDIENIETILPTKANKADVINNVTAGGIDKMLSAQQGVVLSGRITNAQAVADIAQEDIEHIETVLLPAKANQSALEQILTYNFDTYVLRPDKSGMTFITYGLGYNTWFWHNAAQISPSHPYNRIFVRAGFTNAIKIAAISINEFGEAVIVKQITRTPVVGLNTYGAADLALNDLPVYPTGFIAVLNTTNTNRSIPYNTTGGATTFCAVGGGVVAASVADAGYWIETVDTFGNNKLVDQFNDLKTKDQTIDKVVRQDELLVNEVPANRVGTGYVGATNTTTYWGEQMGYFGTNRLKALKIDAQQAGDIEISFINIVSGSAVFLKKINRTCILGVNTFLAEYLSLPPDVYSRGSNIYCVGRNTGPIGSRPLWYKSSTGAGFSFPLSGSPVIVNNSYIMGFWLETYKDEPVLSNLLQKNTFSLKMPNPRRTFNEISAALADNDYVEIPSGVTEISGTLNLKSGQAIVGRSFSSSLKATTTATVLLAESIVDFIISKLTIIGTGSNVDINSTALVATADDINTSANIGAGKGILISKASRGLVEKLSIKNFAHSGIETEILAYSPTGAPIDKTGVTFDTIYLENCYYGINAGTRSEFSSFTKINAKSNVCGFAKRSGNLQVSGNFSTNRIGYAVLAGANDSHGNSVNILADHNKLRAIYVYGITVGEIFSVVQVHDGKIEIKNSKGVSFQACQIGAGVQIIVDGGTAEGFGMHSIMGTVFSAVPDIVLSNNGLLNLKNNFYASGASPASINNNL